MKLLALSALAGIAVIMLAGALLKPVSVIHVRTDDDRIVACQTVGSAENIEVSFTHSMYGGLVTETWQTEDSSIVRIRMVTENAAAAEYYAWDGRIQRAADGYEVTAPATRTEQLRVMVDDIGNHHLRIGDRTWPLASLLDTPVPVTISASREPLVTWLVNRSC